MLTDPPSDDWRPTVARLEVLQRECAGYVSRGLADRVKQVDAVIASLAPAPVVEVPEALPPTVETVVPAKPKGRRG